MNAISKILQQSIIFAAALSLLLFSRVPAAQASVGVVDYDPQVHYPELPSSTRPSTNGQTFIPIYVDGDRVVVEVDGCLFELGDQALELELGALGELTLVFEFGFLYEGAGLILDSATGSALLFEGQQGRLELTLSDEAELFITPGGPQAPTSPIVVRKPSEPEPEPA